VAYRHFPNLDDGVFETVHGVYDALRSAAAESKQLRAPSTAELLDAFRACAELKITSSNDGPLASIAEKAIWKHAERPKAAPAAAQVERAVQKQGGGLHAMELPSLAAAAPSLPAGSKP
jgi:hypothetical protein